MKAAQNAPASAPADDDAQPQPDAPPPPTPNIFAAAAEEARLITWPALPSVLSSTAAVMGIVIGSTLLLLSVNYLLATASEALFG